jgi:hypothetical protein
MTPRPPKSQEEAEHEEQLERYELGRLAKLGEFLHQNPTLPGNSLKNTHDATRLPKAIISSHTKGHVTLRKYWSDGRGYRTRGQFSKFSASVEI